MVYKVPKYKPQVMSHMPQLPANQSSTNLQQNEMPPHQRHNISTLMKQRRMSGAIRTSHQGSPNTSNDKLNRKGNTLSNDSLLNEFSGMIDEFEIEDQFEEMDSLTSNSPESFNDFDKLNFNRGRQVTDSSTDFSDSSNSSFHDWEAGMSNKHDIIDDEDQDFGTEAVELLFNREDQGLDLENSVDLNYESEDEKTGTNSPSESVFHFEGFSGNFEDENLSTHSNIGSPCCDQSTPVKRDIGNIRVLDATTPISIKEKYENGGDDEDGHSLAEIYEDISLALNVRDELLVKAVMKEMEKSLLPKIRKLEEDSIKYDLLKKIHKLPSVSEMSHADTTPLQYHKNKENNAGLFNKNDIITQFKDLDINEDLKVRQIEVNKRDVAGDLNTKHVEVKKKRKDDDENNEVLNQTSPVDSKKRKKRQVKSQVHNSGRSQIYNPKRKLNVIEETTEESIERTENSNDSQSKPKIDAKPPSKAISIKYNYSSPLPLIDSLIEDKETEASSPPVRTNLPTTIFSLLNDYNRLHDSRTVRSLSTIELISIKDRLKNGKFADINKISKLVLKFEQCHSYNGSECIKKLTNKSLLEVIQIELLARSGSTSG